MIDIKHLKPNIPSSKFIELPQEFGWALSSAFGVPNFGLTVSDRLTNDFECSDIKLSLTSGDTSSIVSVDIHKNGTSIFEVPVSIDISGTTSVGATTPFLFNLSASTFIFLEEDKIDFYVSGATDCIGLKIKMVGNRLIYSSMPVYVDSGVDTAVTTATIDIPYPTTVNKDDILFTFIGSRSTNAFNLVPDGWTLVHTDNDGTTGLYGCWWKRADGTETGVQTFGTNAIPTITYGIIHRYSNCVTSGVPYEDNQNDTINGGITIIIKSMTSSGQNRLAVSLAGQSRDNPSSTPTYYTEDFHSQTTIGFDGSLWAFSQKIPNETIVPEDQITVSVERHIAISFLLLPKLIT